MPLRFSGGFGRPGQKPRENCGSRLARVAEAATMPNPFEYRRFRPATRENCNGIAPDPFSFPFLFSSHDGSLTRREQTGKMEK